MPPEKMTARKFFQIDINDLAVMIGSGFFFGSLISCILNSFMTREEIRPYELAAAFVGFVLGRFLSHKTRRRNNV